MKTPPVYVMILVVMFAFLMLSPMKGLIIVVGVIFGIVTLIRYLYWRNEFDYE